MKENFFTKLDRWGALLTALAIAAISIAYLTQSYLASSKLYNIIFLVPMVLIAVFLTVIIIGRSLKMVLKSSSADVTNNNPTPTSDGKNLVIAGLMGGFLVYAFSIRYVGFDVASAFYIAFSLWIQGERRIIVIVLMSVITAFAVTWLLIHGARVPAIATFL
ncbi:tripartite tricarboxylate transporter TctB family protein [Pacificibacter marinus]|uniref:tripartite tricarboxylate transporter TctB family protein n=1 Tax=Pacificibacter marinus TaxID=658057 RepID=UPI001C06C085|nr:tripartite tricarboxylate transporter TctB family protein [Pacificibacter marinus]MBU2867462.1 tripartite tricarboxylate transporter TctB family protein [Pacificibacter marinus]